MFIRICNISSCCETVTNAIENLYMINLLFSSETVDYFPATFC